MSRLGALRALLFSPRRFFAAREPDYAVGWSILVALFTVLVSAVALAATIELVAGSVAPGVDSTPRSHAGSLAAQLRTDLYGRLPATLFYGVLGWLSTGGVLHGFVRLFGGEGPVGHTFAVVGWGLLPSVLRPAAGVMAVALAVAGRTFDGAPERVLRDLLAVVDVGFHPVVVVGAVVAAAWQAFIWARGLQETQGLRSEEAWIAAGVVAVGVLVTGLL